ncbi:MAG: hypothetical protein ACRDDZ_13735 [Marinifilaceae bacterium]
MKQILYTVVLLGGIMCSCNLTNSDAPTKTFEYKAAFNEKYTNGADLYLIGQYVDNKGDTIKINKPLPFELTIHDVPINIKAYFSGYVYSTAANSIMGACTLKSYVIANGSVHADKKVYIAAQSKDLNIPFTEQELKEDTIFRIAE